MFDPKMKAATWIPYALRKVPESSLCQLVPSPERPHAGDIALARLEKIGKNTRLELASGRVATLHEGELLAVVFGNRYATEQFEGYARSNGDACDLMSMGGLCGLVESRHVSIPEPSKLRILGSFADADGRPLRLRDFAVTPRESRSKPKVIVVVGSSMDSGKTYTVMSLIMGLRQRFERVGGIKLTGTAAGRDAWVMTDAGARPALDFIDGGLPSTYLCSTKELLALYQLLVNQAAAAGAEWVVLEIADGLLQSETAALLQTPSFTSTVHSWVFTADSAMAALGGVRLLRHWGIEPVAVSGRLTMSPLSMREAVAATGSECLTAKELQQGVLNDRLIARPTPQSLLNQTGLLDVRRTATG